jgi:Xaa-Pro aminopeptidase
MTWATPGSLSSPGMVFTVEPGIYIREEGMGIRLENDILIGEHGNTDLMAHIPIEVDEIEALMLSLSLIECWHCVGFFF